MLRDRQVLRKDKSQIPTTGTPISVDIHMAIKLVSKRAGVSQRVLTDWLLIKGIVPLLERMADGDSLFTDGAEELQGHQKAIEHVLRHRLPKRPHVIAED